MDPEAEIRELFNNIKVEEVVNAAVDTDGNDLPDRISGAAHNYEYMESPRDDRQTRGEPVTFLLKDLIDKLPPEEKNKLDWDEIMRLSELPDADNTGVSLKYGIYDQDVENAGTITIKLTRDHDPEKHYTDTIGSPAETYTLVVEFSPEYAHRPIASGGDGTYPYHTGDHGLKEAGNIAGKDTSTNNHKINVFAKKLELLKADQSGDTITSDPAAFVLYRKATADEYADDSVTKTELTGMAGKYVAVQTLTTSGGTVTTEALPLLADNEPYYLVETKAPAGYIRLAEPLKVTIDMNGHNTWTKITDNATSQEKPDPFVLSNWLQEATIRLWKQDDTAYDPTQTPSYDHTNDTTDASATYKIINNAGYELPSTGGPGTRLFTILGSILILGAGILLWGRRRTI